MKSLAAWYRKNGDARDVLETGEIDLPEPAAGEVCVRLKTSGVNPSDVKSRRTRPVDAPLIVPHSDGAGVITAVGAGVPASRLDLEWSMAASIGHGQSVHRVGRRAGRGLAGGYD